MKILIAPGMKSKIDQKLCEMLFDHIYYYSIPKEYIQAIEFTYVNGVVSYADIKDISGQSSSVDQEFLDQYANTPNIDMVKIYIDTDKIYERVLLAYHDIKPEIILDD